MLTRRTMLGLAAGSLLLPAIAAAQGQADLDKINRLIDRYGALEDAMDMNAQAQLMAPDRVWLAEGQGRRTDQAANMRIQQASFEGWRKAFPEVRTITEDRDRLVRFHGGGQVAVASFYRYTTVIVPPGTPAEAAKAVSAIPPSGITLVLEKLAGEWKIVHTHVSALFPSR